MTAKGDEQVGYGLAWQSWGDEHCEHQCRKMSLTRALKDSPIGKPGKTEFWVKFFTLFPMPPKPMCLLNFSRPHPEPQPLTDGELQSIMVELEAAVQTEAPVLEAQLGAGLAFILGDAQDKPEPEYILPPPIEPRLDRIEPKPEKKKRWWQW